MPTISELQIKKTELVQSMRSIADLCNTEKRSRTEAENTTWNEVDRSIKTLNAQIKELETLEAHERSLDVRKPIEQRCDRFDLSRAIVNACNRKGNVSPEFMSDLVTRSGSEGIMIPYSERDTGDGLVSNFGSVAIDEVKDTLFMVETEPLYKKLGVSYLPGLRGSVRIPNLAEAEATFVDEEEEVGNGTNDPGAIQLDPERVGITKTFSKEALATYSPALHSKIISDMVVSIDKAITKKVFTVVDAATTDTVDSVSAIGSVGISNLNALMVAKEVDGKFATTRTNFFALKNVKVDEGSGKFLIEQTGMNEGRTYEGVPIIGSTLKVDDSVVFGDWKYCVVGDYGVLEIIIDPYTLAAKGQIKITVNKLVDIAAWDGGFTKLSITAA